MNVTVLILFVAIAICCRFAFDCFLFSYSYCLLSNHHSSYYTKL